MVLAIGLSGRISQDYRHNEGTHLSELYIRDKPFRNYRRSNIGRSTGKRWNIKVEMSDICTLLN